MHTEAGSRGKKLRIAFARDGSRTGIVGAAAILLASGLSIVVIGGPSAQAVTQAPMITISAGGGHSCALTTTGGVECWGDDSGGELDDGSTGASSVPVAASGLSSGVVSISAGFFSTCALTVAGAVECWGDELLGSGTTPTTVSGLSSGVSAISAGYNFACALTSAGGVECWGVNAYGQLGNGTTYNSTVPVAVSGLSSGVVAISAGDEHACALTSAGGVECWGKNYYGQLGDNGATGYDAFSSVPVAVSGLSSGVSAISSGGDHTCALTGTGAVDCWGDDAEGQLGDGTTTSSPVPVPVSGLSSGVRAISAGEDHTCALTNAGAVECWGDNTDGELADGMTGNSSVPVEVNGLSSAVSAITTGYDDTCALTGTGGVECWGYNGYGELGDGTETNSSVPVASSVEGFDTVTFDPEGGAAVDPLSNLDGSTVPLPADDYPGSGYTFLDWNTAPDGSGVTYWPGQQYPLSGSVTLYAQWGDTVTFNTEGGRRDPLGRRPTRVHGHPAGRRLPRLHVCRLEHVL